MKRITKHNIDLTAWFFKHLAHHVNQVPGATFKFVAKPDSEKPRDINVTYEVTSPQRDPENISGTVIINFNNFEKNAAPALSSIQEFLMN